MYTRLVFLGQISHYRHLRQHRRYHRHRIHLQRYRVHMRLYLWATPNFPCLESEHGEEPKGHADSYSEHGLRVS